MPSESDDQVASEQHNASSAGRVVSDDVPSYSGIPGAPATAAASCQMENPQFRWMGPARTGGRFLRRLTREVDWRDKRAAALDALSRSGL